MDHWRYGGTNHWHEGGKAATRIDIHRFHCESCCLVYDTDCMQKLTTLTRLLAPDGFPEQIVRYEDTLELEDGCIASPLAPALFGAHTGSPGISFLTGALGSPEDACALITLLGGSLEERPCIQHDELLDAMACTRLIRTLDEHVANFPPAEALDIRLTLTDEALELLIGDAQLERLRKAFGSPSRSTLITSTVAASSRLRQLTALCSLHGHAARPRRTRTRWCMA